MTIKKPYRYIKMYETFSLSKFRAGFFCYDKKHKDGFHYQGMIKLRNNNTIYISQILEEGIKLNLIKRPSMLDKMNCHD